ncbi:hypothetical protein ACWDNU_47210, partial [Amycolatopsis sp. NPDC003676]
MTEVDTASMTAWVAPRYGGSEVLRTEIVPRPAAGPREVVVRVRAASLCSGDLHLLTGTPYLLRLGFDRRKGRRLACQSEPASDCAVDLSSVPEPAPH